MNRDFDKRSVVTKRTADDWNPEYVRKLWNWVSSTPYMQNTYFTFQVGEGVVNFLEESGRLKGEVLDYGCGAGYLVHHLLDKRLNVWAIDFSAESVALVNSKYSFSPYWKRAKIVSSEVVPYADNFFDVIICTETLEHIQEREIGNLLEEFKRILKPGGVLFVTTPFAEDLKQESVYCPFCDSEFHRWQHLRTFTIEDLKAILISHGFQIDFCSGIDFREFQETMYSVSFQYKMTSLLMVAWKLFKEIIYYGLCRMRDILSPLPFPQGRIFQYKLRRVRPTNICAIVIKN